MATKFNVNDNVLVTHPDVGVKVPGVIIFNDLKGPFPILVKTNVNGRELCLQTPEDGAGVVTHAETSLGAPVVSYIYDTGTASPFRLQENAKPDDRGKTVGIMRAIKNTNDGSYSNFSFESFEEDNANGHIDDGFNPGASLGEILAAALRRPRG